jgi:hypothetical protein
VGLFGVPCAGCARQLRIDADACWGCGRPVGDEERAAEHARRLQRGRWWIGLVAIVIAGWGAICFAQDKNPRVLGVNLGIAAMYGGCWLLARRAPVAALASALGLLVGLWLVGGVLDRSTLLDGFVIKLFALGAFGAGLRPALAARKAMAAR